MSDIPRPPAPPMPPKKRINNYKKRTPAQLDTTRNILESISPELNQLFAEYSIKGSRQRETSYLLIVGLSIDKIANTLEIGTKSVTQYLVKVSKTFGTNNFDELIELLTPYQFGKEE